MVSALFKKFFNPLKEFNKSLLAINSWEEKIAGLSEADFSDSTLRFKDRLGQGESLDDLLPEAFALVRAAAHRALNQRHFDVQLLGGLALHRGRVAQMMTGEGKTLAATAPAYLNALSGRGVHVVTVNEYLARRDTVWMGQIYHLLGLSTACLVHEGAFIYDPDYKIKDKTATDRTRDLTGSFLVQSDYLRPISRREAYQADITYGTNHEFGFDYLRDHLARSAAEQVQRPYYFAIIDEVDSILIDEARTPLIISAPDRESSDWYRTFSRLVRLLDRDKDYIVEEKFKSVSINDNGIAKVERSLGIDNLYAPAHLRLVHFLEESLKAKELFRLDKEYVVRDGQIIIVDEFTGRLMPGRRFSGGLHQALEAKEGVAVKEESRTYAKISLQNYFKMYPKLSGMTGTAATSREEFEQVYGLEVVEIPPHRPLKRIDYPDVIYKTFDAKMTAVVERVKAAHTQGQPVLIGTTSIANNELVSRRLSEAGLPHEILNAKNHEREGAIIAQAGRPGAITVATNMAGRGVDIILGGNPPDTALAAQARAAGGLLVIGTERHEARRIDDQLRGRSGRQGDPGASQFFLSLDDDLLRIFGAERIQSLLERFKFPDDQPIDARLVSRAVREAQKKIEGLNFDSRRHLLQYDDVLNKQRGAAYRYRQELLTESGADVLIRLKEELITHAHFMADSFAADPSVSRREEFVKFLPLTGLIAAKDVASLEAALSANHLAAFLETAITERLASLENGLNLRSRLLTIFDLLWMNHLENMEALAESVRLRAYGQHDPLIEYRKEGHELFERLFTDLRAWLFENIFRVSKESNNDLEPAPVAPSPTDPKFQNVGRNDPCPCGSGKKYKKCHGS